ncbi:MAG: excinuclease ABC subunit UvrC [Cytophagales bacterium]|nr:excinuclease ABC subunit UvrC [Cytophagales bacterium]
MPPHLEAIIKNLPTQPGIYKYYNVRDELIYVGKAKNLKKRVTSYFNKNLPDNKTRVLVKSIERIEFIVVNNENDALLLENNLIKTHTPRYNIMYRDDKSYPFIVVTDEDYPRIFPTRRPDFQQGTLYGPFPGVKAMKGVLDLVKKLYTVRSCDLPMNVKNVTTGKFKKCLEYHIGNCKAPCENLQTHHDYIADIQDIKYILKGNLQEIKKIWSQKIKLYSTQMEYEKAHAAKIKLDELATYQAHSLISSASGKNILVLTKFERKTHIYINYLHIIQGRIIHSKVIPSQDDTLMKICGVVIDEYSDREQPLDEILTNFYIDPIYTHGTAITIPERGEKKHLVDLSLKNTEYYLATNQPITKQDSKTNLLEQIMKDLSLKELPDHIECFDNSNLQGTTPVASMVCFKNGAPSKKDYRHFNIKTVIGANDFDSMREIVYRRYHRLLQENQPLPKLILIDGGKGQLNAAIDSLKSLDIYGKVAIMSIAKRLEEIYLPGDELPVMLSKKSATLLLLQRIRDEAHRFGITFHKKKRDKIK